MQLRKGLFILVLACCLSVAACSSDDSDDDTTAAYVPASLVVGSMSLEEGEGLTGDSPLPGGVVPMFSGEYAFAESAGGVTLNGTFATEAVTPTEAKVLLTTFDTELTFDYADEGWFSSSTISTDGNSLGFRMSYTLSDCLPVRRAVLYEESGDSYLGNIVTSTADEGFTLVKVYEYSAEDAITDVGHDETGDAVSGMVKEYYNGEGRLTREVIYEAMDLEGVVDANVTDIYLYEYNETGRLTKITRHGFNSDFDGDIDSLDADAPSYAWESHLLYDVNGNLTYWVQFDPEETDVYFLAITWQQQEVSAQASAFLAQIHWVDKSPLLGYGALSQFPVLYPIFIYL